MLRFIKTRTLAGLALLGLALAAFFMAMTPGIGPRSYTKAEFTKVYLENVGQFIRGKYSQTTVPRTTNELSRLVDDGFLTRDGLIDRWQNPYAIVCLHSDCRSVRVYSFGENRTDERGGGDDVYVDVALEPGDGDAKLK